MKIYMISDGSASSTLSSIVLELTPESRPVLTVSTQEATSVNSTSAILNANLDSMGNATSVQVGFYLSMSYYDLVDPGNNYTATVPSSILTSAGPFQLVNPGGFQPGQTWYFQAWANGSSFITGEIKTFTLTVQPTLDANTIVFLLLIISFAFLFIVGFFERFAMVGAALVCAIIAIQGWIWTENVFVSAIFIFMMAVCIGLAINKKV
jgi:hypothetical protein